MYEVLGLFESLIVLVPQAARGSAHEFILNSLQVAQVIWVYVGESYACVVQDWLLGHY